MLPLDLVPVPPGRLLGFILSVVIIHPVRQIVRQVLLRHIVMGIIVGIPIAQSTAQFFCSTVMAVAQVPGHLPPLALSYIRQSRINGTDGSVGLGGCRQKNDCLRQRDAGFGQTQHIGTVYAGFYHRDRLGIG